MKIDLLFFQEDSNGSTMIPIIRDYKLGGKNASFDQLLLYLAFLLQVKESLFPKEFLPFIDFENGFAQLQISSLLRGTTRFENVPFSRADSVLLSFLEEVEGYENLTEPESFTPTTNCETCSFCVYKKICPFSRHSEVPKMELVELV